MADDDFYKSFGVSKDDVEKVNLDEWDENGVNVKEQRERQAVEDSIKEGEASKLDREISNLMNTVKIDIQSGAFDEAAEYLGKVEQKEKERAESPDVCDNHEVYWCKVLIKFKARNEDELIAKHPDISEDSDFLRALAYCKNDEQKQHYLSVAVKVKQAQFEEPFRAAEKPAKNAEADAAVDEAVKKKLRRVFRLIDAGDFDEAKERLEKIEQDEIDRTDDCEIPQVYHYKMLIDYKACTDAELVSILIERKEDITKNKNYRLAKGYAEDVDDDDEFDALLDIKKKAAAGIAEAAKKAEEERLRKIASLTEQADEAYKNKNYDNAIDLYNQAIQLGADGLQSKVGQVTKEKEAEEERLLKIASLTRQADEAFKNKKYKNAADLYDQAIKLGADNLQSKAEQAKNKLKEEQAEAERKRKAILNIGDYKDIGNGYVTFGTYPQSKKAGSVQIGQVYDSERGYYLGSDNFLYEKYNNEYYKVEPIKWKVLSRGSELFVVSDMIIDRQIFHSSSNNYANSGIRSWLNNDFYKKAFRDEQKSKIVTTTVDNSLASTGDSKNPYVCGNTSDKVFLLSRKETAQYLTSDESRKRVPTEYAVARGAYQYTDSDSRYKLNGKGCGWWWLRSPYCNDSYYAQSVIDYGGFDWYGVDGSDSGALPALKFKPQ